MAPDIMVLLGKGMKKARKKARKAKRLRAKSVPDTIKSVNKSNEIVSAHSRKKLINPK